MTQGPDLAADFPKATEADWLQLAAKGLDGGSFEERLVARTLDGLAIQPLYTRADLPEEARDGRPGAAPFARGTQAEPRPWDIRQRHAGADPAAVAAEIAEDVAGGVTSVTLQLAVPGQFGLPARMEAIAEAVGGIDLAQVPVGLMAGDQYLGALQCLYQLWQDRGLEGAARRGALDADPLGTLARTGALEEGLWPTLDTLAQLLESNLGAEPNVGLLLADGRPYHEAGASPALELAAMLATFVAYLRLAEAEASLPPERVVPQLGLALAVDDDFLMGMAKLRAARRLVWRVLEACGAGDSAWQMRLAATTSERMLTRLDPHTNILRTTVAAAAAGLAGADAVTVLPFTWALGAPDAFARRIARNVQVILIEESGLARVADPAGGSFTIEALTDQLGRKAWELFQAIEAAGGMPEALASGRIADDVARAAAAEAEMVRDGRRKILGVTAYPSKAPAALAVAPHPTPVPLSAATTRIPPIAARRRSAELEASPS